MDEEKTGPSGVPNESRGAGGEPQFYYSRERRLAKAPESVRALYENRGKPGFSLLRPLVSTKSNAILFGTMAALILISLVVSFSGFAAGEQDYRGSRISVSAVRYEGAALVIIKKTVRGGGAGYTGPLYIAVSPLEESPAAGSLPYPHRVVFSSRKAEEFRFSVPFEEPELLVELSGDPEGPGEGGSLAFRVKTK
jgi:hypothetical protein